MRRHAPHTPLGSLVVGSLLLGSLLPGVVRPASADTLAVPLQYGTIQEAIDAAANAGDTIEVAAGIYPEALDTGGKAITFVGVGGDVEILSFLANGGLGQISETTSLFAISIAGPLTVAAGDTNFTLDQTDVGGATSLLFDTQAELLITNSSFAGDVLAGGSGLDGLTSLSSTFHEPVNLTVTSDAFFSDNDFEDDVAITAEDFLVFGGNDVQGGSVTLSGNDLDAVGNTVTDADRYGIRVVRSQAGGFAYVADNVVVGSGRNPLPGTTPAGIEIGGPGGAVTVEYNVVSNGRGGLLVEAGISGDAFRHNTIVGLSEFGFRAENLPPAGSPFSFRNNVVATTSETATALDLWLNIDPTDEDSWTFNSTSGPGTAWGGTSDLTGQYGNISGDPGLCNTGTPRPTSGSPLLPGNHPTCEAGGLIGALDFDGSCPHDFVIDGDAESLFGDALATQGVATHFGNNTLGLPDHANGSELDGLFATVNGRVLHILVAGNLESNANKLEIFFDSVPGGQNRLRGDNPNVDNNGLNRMGDNGSGNGLTFENDFSADHFLTFTGADPGSGYRLFASFADLEGGTGVYLGSTGAVSDGTLTGGDNSLGIRATIDNSNVGGVPAGTAPASGAGVTTGIEMSIPLCALGIPDDQAFGRGAGEIKICAFVNGVLHDFVSNQVLGSLQAPQANLGEPRNVDFSALPGQQFVSIPLAPGPVGAPIVTGGSATSAVLLGAAPNPFRKTTAIRFSLPAAGQVRVDVFNVQGRRVATVLDGVLPAGFHAVTYEPAGLASGIYFYRVEAGSFSAVRKVTLLK